MSRIPQELIFKNISRVNARKMCEYSRKAYLDWRRNLIEKEINDAKGLTSEREKERERERERGQEKSAPIRWRTFIDAVAIDGIDNGSER